MASDGEALLGTCRVQENSGAFCDIALHLLPKAVTNPRRQIADEDSGLRLDHPTGKLAPESRLYGGYDQNDDGSSSGA